MTAPTDVAEVEFRLRTLRTGVWPSLAVVGYMLVYVVATWGDRAHRGALAAMCVVALATTLVVARMPSERIVRSRWREAFFAGWSIGLVVMIAVGAALDGGATSPIAALLFLPLAYSALSYPFRALMAVGIADVAAYLLVVLIGGGVSAWHAFLVCGGLVNATWICGWLSRNHGDQRRELARVSRSDALTGTLNRRGFEERFAAELARAHRDRAPLALAVVDLDDFKAVNDRYGHAAGDRLLRDVVCALDGATRETDVVGRLGGDEFGVLLVGGDHTAALARLETALAAVSPASFGTAVFPLDGTDEEQLHHAADAALYLRKHGRPHRGASVQRELSWAAALAGAVDRRMSVEHDHGGAVAAYAAGIATELGWHGAELDDLRLAAMLHDVGKVHVPERILRKPGPLDAAEWAILRDHPVTGADLLSQIDGLERIVPWVRHSHERLDGRGYPDGLAGEAIPLAARILLVADAFDAMTSDRAYRRALDRDQALLELRVCAGTQFDPACVEALERHLASVPS